MANWPVEVGLRSNWVLIIEQKASKVKYLNTFERTTLIFSSRLETESGHQRAHCNYVKPKKASTLLPPPHNSLCLMSKRGDPTVKPYE